MKENLNLQKSSEHYKTNKIITWADQAAHLRKDARQEVVCIDGIWRIMPKPEQDLIENIRGRHEVERTRLLPQLWWSFYYTHHRDGHGWQIRPFP
jgi:hypothetical protein